MWKMQIERVKNGYVIKAFEPDLREGASEEKTEWLIEQYVFEELLKPEDLVMGSPAIVDVLKFTSKFFNSTKITGKDIIPQKLVIKWEEQK